MYRYCAFANLFTTSAISLGNFVRLDQEILLNILRIEFKILFTGVIRQVCIGNRLFYAFALLV